jgi:hypothetical protein
MDPLEQRQALDRLIKANGDDYMSLSKLIGRNAAYLQQFMKRGTPHKLAEKDRSILARYFGVDDSMLGGPKVVNGLVAIPILDVQASAGPGALTEREQATASMQFDPRWLRKLTSSKPEKLTIIQILGDSMAPTLSSGDEVMVDAADGSERLRDGIYILRLDDVLMAKRITVNPGTRRISILSDNPTYTPFQDVDRQSFQIVGRVLWFGRKV